ELCLGFLETKTQRTNCSAALLPCCHLGGLSEGFPRSSSRHPSRTDERLHRRGCLVVTLAGCQKFSSEVRLNTPETKNKQTRRALLVLRYLRRLSRRPRDKLTRRVKKKKERKVNTLWYTLFHRRCHVPTGSGEV